VPDAAIGLDAGNRRAAREFRGALGARPSGRYIDPRARIRQTLIDEEILEGIQRRRMGMRSEPG
jgi:hypothetical protein